MEDEKNEYYNEDILDIFGKQYLPLIPLWSGLMLGNLERHTTKIDKDREECQLEDGGINRDTNSTVENWMKIVKQDTLIIKKKVRVGKFVRVMHTVLKGRLAEFQKDASCFSKTNKGEKSKRQVSKRYKRKEITIEGETDDSWNSTKTKRKKLDDQQKNDSDESIKKTNRDGHKCNGSMQRKGKWRKKTVEIEMNKSWSTQKTTKDTVECTDNNMKETENTGTLKEEMAQIAEEKWKKKEESRPEKKSYYFTPPKKFPASKPAKINKPHKVKKTTTENITLMEERKSHEKKWPGIQNNDNTC